MNHSQNRFVEFSVFTVGMVMVGYLLAKGFSGQIGLDIAAGGRLLFSITLCVGLIGYAVWCELTEELFRLRALLPLALSTLWSGMWPAMEYWETKSLHFPGLPTSQQDLEWWANTYTQWGG